MSADTSSEAVEATAFSLDINADEVAILTQKRACYIQKLLRALAQERDARAADAQGHARDARHAESVADAWKKHAEELAEKADKFMWQVRDTCTRAEKAETERDAARAEAARLREALKGAADDLRYGAGKARTQKAAHTLFAAEAEVRAALAATEEPK